MMKNYAAPLSAVLLGAVCAILNWYICSSAQPNLMLLCGSWAIASVLTAYLACRSTIVKERTFEEHFAGDSTLLKLLSVVGGMLLALGGVGSALSLLTMKNLVGFSVIAQFAFGILGIIACICCILLTKAQARAQMNEKVANTTILLMLWSAFGLIMKFKENNTNPHMTDYLSALLSGIALTLATLEYCRMLYSKPNPRRFLIYASVSVMLTCASAGAAALLTLLPGESVGLTLSDLAHQISALGMAIYLTGQMIRMCAPRRQTYYWVDAQTEA